MGYRFDAYGACKLKHWLLSCSINAQVEATELSQNLIEVEDTEEHQYILPGLGFDQSTFGIAIKGVCHFTTEPCIIQRIEDISYKGLRSRTA